MKTQKLLVCGILAASLATIPTLTAQPAPPGPQDGPPRPGRQQGPPRDFAPGGPERMQRMAPGQMGAVGLMRLISVLTPEQRASVRELMEENRAKSKETEEKLLDARKELIEASLSEDFNEKAVRKQAKIIADIEADRMVELARVLSKVDPPLTEGQRRQIQEPPPFQQGEWRQAWRDRRFGAERNRPLPPGEPREPRKPREAEDKDN